MLRVGSTGAAVRRLQEKLKSAGLYSGKIDGIFGPLTRAAVVSYQRKHKLSVDGIAGPQTLGKLGLSGGSSSSSSAAKKAPKLQGVPGGGEVWSIGGKNYLVYSTPKNGVPVAYRLNSAEYKALFEGISSSPSAHRSFKDMKAAQKRTGVLPIGVRTDIRGTAEKPFATLSARFKRLVKSQPWLKDPEVLAIYSAAMLEGRAPTDAELKSTKWFRTRTEGERQWALLSMSDPATAKQVRIDNRNSMTSMAKQLGINNLPTDVRNWIENKWTTGAWSQERAVENLRRLADPYRGSINKELKAFLGKRRGKIDTTQEHIDTVQNLIGEWLGPTHLASSSSKSIRDWAGRLRNDPDAEQALVESLRKRRLGLFSAYTDPNTTYADIDAMWRPVVQGIWGEDPDHKDGTYRKILQLNDAAEAEKLLRSEGLKRGNRSVGMDALSQLHSVLGGTVRRAV